MHGVQWALTQTQARLNGFGYLGLPLKKFSTTSPAHNHSCSHNLSSGLLQCDLYEVALKRIQKLQIVQNVTAWVANDVRYSLSVSPLLCEILSAIQSAGYHFMAWDWVTSVF